MCGCYRRTTKEEELARQYNIPIPPALNLPISYNIAPSQNVLAVRFNPKRAQRSLDALRWGLIPYWAKDPKIGYRRSTQGWSPSIPRRRIGKLSRDADA
jgi:putative SOS response-associated peptidase YedK